MQQDIYILPASWASALVNNDKSGLSTNDCIALEKWIFKAMPGECVQVSDDTWYARSNDASNIAGEVAAYTFVY